VESNTVRSSRATCTGSRTMSIVVIRLCRTVRAATAYVFPSAESSTACNSSSAGSRPRENPLRECGRGARCNGLAQEPPASGLVSDLSTDLTGAQVPPVRGDRELMRATTVTGQRPKRSPSSPPLPGGGCGVAYAGVAPTEASWGKIARIVSTAVAIVRATGRCTC
jgi:hypothetical protein